MGWERYGSEFRQESERVRADAVGKICWRCGQIILPGQKVEAGHVVDKAIDPNSKALAPEHRRCNRKAGGRLGKRKSRFNPSRAW